MMAKEEKKAPKLRFNGYTNDWEHVKPKKYLKISKVPGSNGLIAKKLTVKLWGKGVVEKDTTFNGSENTKYFTRKSGQLMYGKLDFLHAAFGIVPQNLNNYESTADSPAFDINDAGDRTFLINYFLRPEFYLKNGEKANGSRKAKRIHEETFLNMPMQAPIKSEQEKIAKTFNSLNNTIQLHERKCEELALIKKVLLQKLFPKKDEIKPEVRYKNFSDAWEQRKLGEVATFINGRAYKQNELLDSGKYKVLRVGNFYTNDSWYYSNLELADKYYIDEGDLVYTWSATFGPHIWNGEKVIYHYHIWKIELSKFLDRDFTLQILEADKAKLLANTNGSTMIHVTKKDMESKVISLPNIEEQKKIGSYLMKFDSLITLHQRELEKLKQLKKYLLQNMFI